jgi:pimeloyl-ACP methyl ester carboxylesterase
MTALRDALELSGARRASYEVVGEGEPMLYFQGGPGAGAAPLREDAALLQDRFAVHLIDPHGCGASTPPSDPAAYDHIGHARFYEDVREALEIERVTVMGISFGSMVALTYPLLLVGGLDMICGPAHGHAIARATPHAEAVTVPDSGHFIPAEAPEEFRDAVISFCDAHPV